MKTYKRHKTKSRKNTIVPLLTVITVLLVILMVCLIISIEAKDGWSQQTDPNIVDTDSTEELPTSETKSVEEVLSELLETTEQPTLSYIGIPYTLENGKLEITSVFQYSGMNPECAWEFGENFCVVELHNLSGEHLAWAEFKLYLSDGSVMEFEVVDVPAGETVWAFELNSTYYDSSASCESVECTARFEANSELMEEQVLVEVNGMDVSITNLSKNTLTDLTVTCHSVLDQVYFGGVVFDYAVDIIPPGEMVIFTAEDCFLDTAEVVRITTGG